MSTETLRDGETETTSRGLVDRVRASPFLSQLLSNRLALAGIAIIVAMLVIAVYARLTLDLEIISRSQLGTNPNRAAPSLEYPFGTDGQARDLLPRVGYGAWYAMLFGTVTVGASTVLGVGLGIIAAYYGDITDNVIMRTMDVLLAFPSLLLALALVSIFPDELGLWRAVAALTLVYAPVRPRRPRSRTHRVGERVHRRHRRARRHGPAGARQTRAAELSRADHRPVDAELRAGDHRLGRAVVPRVRRLGRHALVGAHALERRESGAAHRRLVVVVLPRPVPRVDRSRVQPAWRRDAGRARPRMREAVD